MHLHGGSEKDHKKHKRVAKWKNVLKQSLSTRKIKQENIAYNCKTITSLHTLCSENEESSGCASFFASQFDVGLSAELSAIILESFCVPLNC